MEMFRNDFIRVTTPESRDPATLKVEVIAQAHQGILAITKLIEQSSISAEGAPVLFDFAGQHTGMPRWHVWALSKDGGPAANYLPEIVQRTHNALGIPFQGTVEK